MKHLQKKPEADFDHILEIIHQGKNRALQAINIALIETYWQVGRYLSQKVADSGWGKGVVKQLSEWIANKAPDVKGFSAQNLWRMKQLFEAYRDNTKLSALLRVLSWTHHCILLAQCKTDEERCFYAELCASSTWSSRELEHQIKRGVFERMLLAGKKLSPVMKELPQDVTDIFKDSYLLDFLDLPEQHIEKDLQSALVKNLHRFLTELGHGFCFVGEKVRLEVGNTNFELDLLFFHRDLQCLVAFELKTGKFQPEHLGQLSFYLEAIDRDHKRPHENPSIGVLLCRSKDDEVVEYALSRTLSPALVAEYETRLIPKALLKQKLHEWARLIEEKQAEITDSAEVTA